MKNNNETDLIRIIECYMICDVVMMVIASVILLAADKCDGILSIWTTNMIVTPIIIGFICIMDLIKYLIEYFIRRKNNDVK